MNGIAPSLVVVDEMHSDDSLDHHWCAPCWDGHPAQFSLCGIYLEEDLPEGELNGPNTCIVCIDTLVCPRCGTQLEDVI